MNADTQSDHLFFHYKLFLSTDRIIEFTIEIDPATETFISPIHESPPFWAELDYQQCENCPLSKTQTRYCPVATNLIPLIELCATLTSYEAVRIEVVTLERTVSADTTMQRALSSILGLIMATSACPHTEYFKPMAHFHLPLASPDETVYRPSSMFLLAQYFLHKDGLDSTLALDKLTDIYKEIQVINRALARRFRAAISKDATVNAIILLDLLSQSVTWSIEDGLEHLRHLFKRYGVQ
jgi:hypothetical protein